MDSTSGCAGSTDLGAVYEAAMARRSLEQQRAEAVQAVRLIEAAAPAAGAGPTLPANATISIRV